MQFNNNTSMRSFWGDSRKRTIVITIAVAVILLIALVVVIVNAVKRPSQQLAGEEADTSLDTPVDIAEVKEETLDPVDNSEDSGTTTVESTKETKEEATPAPVAATPATTTSADIPTTGPEDIFPLIMLVSFASIYFASRNKVSA